VPLPVSLSQVAVPGDSREQRARRIAALYRQQLEASDPAACRALDQLMYDAGEYWVADRRPLDPEELLSAPDLAQYLGIRQYDLRNWSNRGHIGKYTADDGSPLYSTGEVLAHMASKHATRAEKCQRR
jgi:hypothetical protein